eukprot:GHRQ01035825.1.p2 GENE.GHRQ01035825.1~~GHRQ01035825.1.p2  ORF type:complete len:113 (+),score=43.83 GHRQ01035825.1:361-699(+)
MCNRWPQGPLLAHAFPCLHVSFLPLAQALVMKALVGLLTVLYKSFPTSIQADKAHLAQLQQQSAKPATADVLEAERLTTAVQFRLGLKLLLERSTMSVIVRLKELLQQQPAK